MFQTPKMKLFNFEQFQFMLNQIQITQLTESVSSANPSHIKINPYQILNQIIHKKQINENSETNQYNSQKQLQQIPVGYQQNYPSPKNQQSVYSSRTQNNSSNPNGQFLKQSNSNKSIGVYSSRSSQQDQQQQLQKQKIEQARTIKQVNNKRNNDLVSTVLNTAPCYSTVEECSEQLKDLNISYEAVDETMQMKELSCSIQDDQIEDGQRLKDKNNYKFNCNSQETSSSLEKMMHIKNQLNRIEDEKNNPTIISRSNSQNQLDPLLQNLNVKKMCEVQKHYCKKRIREFRQPCEDIVQYQEFINMINQRGSKENAAASLSSNRRIKTENSQNSLKQKPPTSSYQNQYNQNLSSMNSQQNILCVNNNIQNQQNFASNSNQNNYNNSQHSFQVSQNQIIQEQNANCNILKPKYANNQFVSNQNETTYSELNSKIFKFKKKNQPSLQENILAHQIQQQQHLSQFNSNKENSLCDITSLKNTNKNNCSYNQTQKGNFNISLNNQNTFLIGSRENSISNYDSRNSKSYAANSKNQHKQVLQNTICPIIKQAQQQQQQQLKTQKSQSPFYLKGSQQEREQKSIIFRELRTNSTISYNSKNNTSFNGQQTNKSNLSNIPLKIQNPPIFSVQNPLISQRSRISTMEGNEKNQCDNLQIHNNQKLQNFLIYRQNNISKSSDTTSTNQYYQNLNLITNQNNIGLLQNVSSNKNAVPFNQSYYKRQQQQQQQQQTTKQLKNLKQLNFNCLNYIRKYKEIIELQIAPFIQQISHDDILEHQNAYKQSLLIMTDQVEISCQEDLQNFQDFLSLRSKCIYNQYLSRYGFMLQI